MSSTGSFTSPYQANTGSIKTTPATKFIASELATIAGNDNDELEIFRFLDLSAELRLLVYNMAFVRDTPIYLRMIPKKAESDDGYDSVSDCEYSLPTDLNWERTIAPTVSGARNARITKAARPHRCSAATRSTRSSTRTHGETSRGGKAGGRGRFVPSRKVLMASWPRDRAERSPCKDPLVPQLLVVSKRIYQEAHPVLYKENTFALDLDSSVRAIESLRQPSRSLIQNVTLIISTQHDLLDGFADLVRLGLRYCWELKTLTLTLPNFSNQDRYAAFGHSAIAKSFDILRWLPQGTEVIIDRGATNEICKVIAENSRIAKSLDKAAYLRRQHQMPERQAQVATQPTS